MGVAQGLAVFKQPTGGGGPHCTWVPTVVVGGGLASHTRTLLAPPPLTKSPEENLGALPPVLPGGTLGYGTCAQVAGSTKLRKKIGSSVAYKTTGTFVSKVRRQRCPWAVH